MSVAGVGRVGRYQLLRLLAHGGQGSVYVAWDERAGCKVAVKRLRQQHDKQARADLLREARLLAGLRGPQLVPLYDVVSGPRTLALVMAYVPGIDLQQLTIQRRLSLAAVLRVAVDLAAALAQARALVHGDIKASNLLIGPDGRVRLIDFGLASPVGESASGSAGMSPCAAAPEQWLGEPASPHSDLFCMGLLLFRLLVGEHPYGCRPGQTHAPAFDSASAQLPRRTVFGEAIPAPLRALVQSLIEPDPRDRPAHVGLVQQALREVSSLLSPAWPSALLEESRPYFRLEPALPMASTSL